MGKNKKKKQVADRFATGRHGGRGALLYGFRERLPTSQNRALPSPLSCPNHTRHGSPRKHEESKLSAERTRLDSRLTLIRNRMDAAYADKLDGKIPQDFWERKMSKWRSEEQQVKMAINGPR